MKYIYHFICGWKNMPSNQIIITKKLIHFKYLPQMGKLSFIFDLNQTGTVAFNFPLQQYFSCFIFEILWKLITDYHSYCQINFSKHISINKTMNMWECCQSGELYSHLCCALWIDSGHNINWFTMLIEKYFLCKYIISIETKKKEYFWPISFYWDGI